jgi:putative membrane protein
MTIEGIPDYRALRDFLYSRMRGAKGLVSAPEPAHDRPTAPASEVAVVLREAVDELRAIRTVLEQRSSRDEGGGLHG